MHGDADDANQSAVFFPPAHIPRRLFHQVGEPPEPAPLQELAELQRGRAAAHRQLPPTQDHRQGELRQGQTGTACAHRTRGEGHERVVLSVKLRSWRQRSVRFQDSFCSRNPSNSSLFGQESWFSFVLFS